MKGERDIETLFDKQCIKSQPLKKRCKSMNFYKKYKTKQTDAYKQARGFKGHVLTEISETILGNPSRFRGKWKRRVSTKMRTNCNSNTGKEYTKGSLCLLLEEKNPGEFTFGGSLTHIRIGRCVSPSAIFYSCFQRHRIGGGMVAVREERERGGR